MKDGRDIWKQTLLQRFFEHLYRVASGRSMPLADGGTADSAYVPIQMPDRSAAFTSLTLTCCGWTVSRRPISKPRSSTCGSTVTTRRTNYWLRRLTLVHGLTRPTLPAMCRRLTRSFATACKPIWRTSAKPRGIVMVETDYGVPAAHDRPHSHGSLGRVQELWST